MNLPPRLLLLSLLLALLLLLALGWQFSPARDWLQPQALLQAVDAMGFASQLLLFVLALCAALPLSLLVLLAVLALGPLQGALLALLGAALAGLLGFGCGALLGREAVARWAGPKLQALNALVARRGVLAVVLVRLVPVAPFTLVNLVLGTTPVRTPAFVLGNSLGMLPMVVLTAWLAPQILAQLQQPGGYGLLALAALIAFVLLVGALLKRWVARL